MPMLDLESASLAVAAAGRVESLAAAAGAGRARAEQLAEEAADSGVMHLGNLVNRLAS